MKSILLLGECMVELRNTAPSTLHQSFAGDAFNTAVYLKRLFTETPVSFATAIGTDSFSQAMRELFKHEQINDSWAFTSASLIPGLYAIETDDEGERSFTYWRENSAAKQLMTFIDDKTIDALSQQHQMVFFSGISLAVIQQEQRPLFWDMIDKMKAKGLTIVFDPNYRPRMWSTPDAAKIQFELAFSKADILLPGIDDFEQLYGIDNASALIEFCSKYNANELIIKNGPETVISVTNGSSEAFHITPADNVVDTTSAGDSFNGAYLGARLNGHSISEAIDLGAKTAAFVIQHKGAIVDADQFKKFSLTLSIN
ncbi:sugar kinase [Shewanella donghaensis]|uniref:sugar kinase n=1 Tax=Shewanella donghaensis TaxID=238836 RepID=UPI0011835AFB|nr:sugar kinase [Shewanella donghaensis]